MQHLQNLQTQVCGQMKHSIFERFQGHYATISNAITTPNQKQLGTNSKSRVTLLEPTLHSIITKVPRTSPYKSLNLSLCQNSLRGGPKYTKTRTILDSMPQMLSSNWSEHHRVNITDIAHQKVARYSFDVILM